MIELLKNIKDTFFSMNPTILALFGVVTFIKSVFNFVNEMIGELLAKVATLILSPASAAIAVDGMSWFNYMFPLTELFAFAAAACTAFGVAAVIRIIKSFIPTVA